MKVAWSRQLHRLKKHGSFVAAALAGLWLTHLLVPATALKATNEVGGNFLQTFGGMYGIIVAFALYVVWQQHNDTQVALEREATSLGELHRVLKHFVSWPGRDAARAKLREYALAVPQNNRPVSSTRGDEAIIFRETVDAFLGWNAPTTAEERLFSLALDLFHEVNEAREHRRTSASLRMGEGMRGFVIIGGVGTVATLWLMSMDSFPMHAVLTGLLTWVVVAAASIAFDLDDPYTGDFIVDFTRFHDLTERMAAD
jgi:Protein of unknown function (DUF4239)